VVSATGSFCVNESSGEFGVRGTVRQQRIGDLHRFINRCVTDLTRAVGPCAQTLECSINVIECCFNRAHTLVGKLCHVFTLALVLRTSVLTRPYRQ